MGLVFCWLHVRLRWPPLLLPFQSGFDVFWFITTLSMNFPHNFSLLASKLFCVVIANVTEECFDIECDVRNEMYVFRNGVVAASKNNLLVRKFYIVWDVTRAGFLKLFIKLVRRILMIRSIKMIENQQIILFSSVPIFK